MRSAICPGRLPSLLPGSTGDNGPSGDSRPDGPDAAVGADRAGLPLETGLLPFLGAIVGGSWCMGIAGCHDLVHAVMFTELVCKPGAK